MKVAILDDYCNTIRSLQCFEMLTLFEVTIWNARVEDVDVLAYRLRDGDVLVLIRERTKFRIPR
jgi:D-3-phosphoglycerate dehydrogenase